MKMPKAEVLTTDAQIDVAIALAKLREPFRPKAVAAAYRAEDDMLVVNLRPESNLPSRERFYKG